MRSSFATGALVALLFVGAAQAPAMATPTFPAAVKAIGPPPEEKDYLQLAAENAQRSPQNKARDRWRHPVESLTFWGIRPGDVILELDPGGGYWAEMLAAFARSTDGRYIGALPDPTDPKDDAEQKRDRDRFLGRFGDKTTWGEVAAARFGPGSGPTGQAAC